jgi:hypothetical protein
MSKPGQFLLYTAPSGAVKVNVFIQQETVWLTQKALAELFGVKRPAITKHLLNIFKTGELVEDSVSPILEHTAGDGKKYGTKYYNLDAIIAVCLVVALPSQRRPAPNADRRCSIQWREPSMSLTRLLHTTLRGKRFCQSLSWSENKTPLEDFENISPPASSPVDLKSSK